MSTSMESPYRQDGNAMYRRTGSESPTPSKCKNQIIDLFALYMLSYFVNNFPIRPWHFNIICQHFFYLQQRTMNSCQTMLRGIFHLHILLLLIILNTELTDLDGTYFYCSPPCAAIRLVLWRKWIFNFWLIYFVNHHI